MMRATVLSPRRIWVLLPAVAILGLLLTACGDAGNTAPPPASGATAEASRPGQAATVVPVEAATPSQPVIASGMADGYMVLAPAVLRSGQTEHVSISLFSGNQPAAGDVQLALLREGSLVAEGNTFIKGTGPAPLTVPSLPRRTLRPASTRPWLQRHDARASTRRDRPVFGDRQASL